MLICASRRLLAPVGRASRSCLFHKVVKKCNGRIRRAIGIRLPNSAEWRHSYAASGSGSNEASARLADGGRNRAHCGGDTRWPLLPWRAGSRRSRGGVREVSDRRHDDPSYPGGRQQAEAGGQEMQMRGVRAHSSRAATG